MTPSDPKAPLEIYQGLPPGVKVSLQETAERIRTRIHNTVENLVDIGNDLKVAKKALGHGNFGPWIVAEFGMSDQTARNLMNVATRFGKSKTFLDFKITTGAIYSLASPSTPAALIEEVMETAATGKTINKKTIDDLKGKVKKPKANQKAKREAEPELREAVEQGKVAVSRAAATIRSVTLVPPPARKKKAAWRVLGDALEALNGALNGLPDATTVACMVPASQRDLISRRLPVIGWLAAFEAAWKLREASRR